MTTTLAAVDESKVEEFAGRLVDLCTSGLICDLLEIGRRTGLLDALASGSATSEELAERSGLVERYVREWLAALATAGIVEYDPDERRYSLPPERAACLTGSTVANLAPLAYLTAELGRHVPAVAAAFRSGGGVPYAAYLPEMRDVLDALGEPIFRDLLPTAVVDLVPGLRDRLTAGAKVADLACGTGLAALSLAVAFPASSFVGYDLDTGALDVGRARAAERGVSNVRFEAADAATLEVPEQLDAVFVNNALHDQVDPPAMLQRIFLALRPGGVLVLNEPRVSSDVGDNLGSPFAPLLYAISVLHCLTVSLAEGGAGLGTAFGEQVCRRLLADAGFRNVAVHEAPGDPTNAVFVAHRP